MYFLTVINYSLHARLPFKISCDQLVSQLWQVLRWICDSEASGQWFVYCFIVASNFPLVATGNVDSSGPTTPTFCSSISNGILPWPPSSQDWRVIMYGYSAWINADILLNEYISTHSLILIVWKEIFNNNHVVGLQQGATPASPLALAPDLKTLEWY